MELVEAAHWMDDEADDHPCLCWICKDNRDEFYEQADTVRPGRRCRTSVEQVGKAQHTSQRHRRDEKRLTVRLMRRASKRFLDDAPKRIPFRGWAD